MTLVESRSSQWPESAPIEPPATVLPVSPVTPAPRRRDLHGIAREDLLVIGGAFVSAASTTLLLFGRLTPLSGTIGFFIVLYVAFVATYAFLVSLTDDRPAVLDRTMTALMSGAAFVAGAALVWVVASTIWKGRKALKYFNLFTEDMSKSGPLEPLSTGGIQHAIVGTLIIIGIALVLTVPLSIACAVFLTESGSRLANTVRTVVTAMTALPSIVAGLFIYATWILILGWPR